MIAIPTRMHEMHILHVILICFVVGKTSIDSIHTASRTLQSHGKKKLRQAETEQVTNSD